MGRLEVDRQPIPSPKLEAVLLHTLTLPQRRGGLAAHKRARPVSPVPTPIPPPPQRPEASPTMPPTPTKGPADQTLVPSPKRKGFAVILAEKSQACLLPPPLPPDTQSSWLLLQTLAENALPSGMGWSGCPPHALLDSSTAHWVAQSTYATLLRVLVYETGGLESRCGQGCTPSGGAPPCL